MARRIWFGVTVVVAAICVGLSGWQWQRRADRIAANRLALAGRELPPIDLAASAGAERAERRGTARGTFDPAFEVTLRNHLLDGAPGVQIVTPLRLEGSDSAVFVHRGFVPAADAAVPDVAVPEEPGMVLIQGIVLPIPRSDDGGQPVEHRGRLTWRRMDLDALRARTPYPVLDVYLLALPDTSRRGWPRRIVPPPLDEGPHLSYAIQWLGIAGAVLGFGLFFILGIGRRIGVEVPPAPLPPRPPA